MSEETNDETHLGNGFNIHTDISSIHIDKKGSAKSKLVLGLSLVALWVPFIPSIVALIILPSARREIVESNGKLTGLRMLSWGKAIAWITIAMDTLGIIILTLVLLLGHGIITEMCLQGEEIYCTLDSIKL